MKRYDNIQILRVAACLGVFVTHVAPKMGITGVWGRIANFGASGVYLFFLVSAFLACNAPAVRSDVVSYYIRRAFRILPLYYGIILYDLLLHTVLLQDVPPDPQGLGWLRYLFLTSAVLPAPDNFWGNLSGTWTISLFMAFYLCAPLLIRVAGVGGREISRKTMPTGSGTSAQGQEGHAAEKRGRGTLPMGVIRATALYAASLLLQQIWIRQRFSDHMMFFYYMHFFSLGILAWQLAWHYGPVAAAWRFALICAAAGAGLHFWGGEIPYFTGVSWIFGLLMLLTLDFSWEKLSARWEGRKGAGLIRGCRRLIDRLDTYSYGIYLVHGIMVEGIAMIQTRISLSGLPVLLLMTALTAAGVWLAHKLIEVPAQKLGGTLAGRIKGPTPV